MNKVKPTLLRGFEQEFLPREQLQFNDLVDTIRRVFELHGFLPLETPSAERREVLTSKGGIEKEIYALTRLAEADSEDAANKGALRFDLTVPLARYVAMRERDLAFPFRRYQIQRVWRGETPQARKGRFREFYQCDIDIIGREKLSYLAEAEIPSVIYRVFREMEIGEFRIRINNRKVLRGLLQSVGVTDAGKSADVLRLLDKVEKEDASAILKGLHHEGLSPNAADDLYGLIAGKRDTRSTFDALAGLPHNEALQTGMEEARKIVDGMHGFGVPDSAFSFDLAVVRGLDYYTGTIYETTLVGAPELGSICSGGRYDDLASYFTDTKLPGVGISIGLSRLFARLSEAGLLKPPLRTPAEVLVTSMEPERMQDYLKMAQELRDAGINTELYLEPAKFKKQLEYAEKKGFRAAVVAGGNEFANAQVQLKNLATREQTICARDGLAGAVRELLGHPQRLR